MSRLVIDSGVAVKWFVSEAQSADAARIRDAYDRSALTLLAPDFFVVEFGNVIWKKQVFQGLDPADAQTAVSGIRAVAILYTRSADLLDDAYRLAVAHRRTVYDSLYLALALREGCPFVTADQKLVNALAGTVPGVTWLGNWP
jgi:predicted nucleic acid-binding protein